MTRTATHKGHCQICGHFQKLPGGTLAKHGYTTRWGFFEGTCRGAHNLPFEQSIDLIEDAIAGAIRTADHLAATAATLRAESAPATAWVHEYRKATHGTKSHYAWRELPISELDLTGLGTYTHTNGSKAQLAVYGTHGDPAATVRVLNERRAAYLTREAMQYREYAAWQTERIAGWQPSALTPVAA